MGGNKEIVLKSDQKLILKENLKFYEESLIQSYWHEFNLKGYLIETSAKLEENEAKIVSRMKELEKLSKKLRKIQKETEKKEKEKIVASNAAEILMEMSTSQTKARLYVNLKKRTGGGDSLFENSMQIKLCLTKTLSKGGKYA